MQIPATARVVKTAADFSVLPSGTTDVVFKAGEYGALILNGVKPPSTLNVWSEPGAHFEKFWFRNGTQNIKLIAPNVWPKTVTTTPFQGVIDADRSCSNIEVYRADVRSCPEAANYGAWTHAEWYARKSYGIKLWSKNSKIRECRSLGLDCHYEIAGAGSEISDSIALGISQDGFHAIGDGVGWDILRNYAGDYVTISDGKAHPDGQQAFCKAAGGLANVTGMLWAMNIIDNITVGLLEDAGVTGGLLRSNPIRIAPQGTGLHTGSYSNLTVRGNKTWTEAPWAVHVNLVRGSNALIENNEGYDPLGRWNAAYMGGTGRGLVQRNNVCGYDEWLGIKTKHPLDYTKTPKAPPPPAWNQWA